MFAKLEKLLGKKVIPLVIIPLIAMIVYSNSLFVPFYLDDFGSISNNYAIRNPLDFMAIWKFYSNRFIIYYTFSINYFFHDNAVIGYHIVNILIHALNGILVFLIIKTLLSHDYFKYKLSGRFKCLVSFLCSLLFVVHPINVNAVTYIVQRTASLAGTFYFLAILFYLKFRMKDKVRYFFLTFLFTVLAMFTKENTITIPFMILLIELMFFTKGKNGIDYKGLFFWLVLTVCTVPIVPCVNMFGHLLGGYNQSDPGASFKASTNMDRMHYFYTELNVVLLYIRLLFIPDHLNFDYSNDFAISKTIMDNGSYISFGILLLIGIYGVMNFRKNKLVSLGILWFFIGLSVESSFISIKDVYFEHRLYVPLVGFVLFLAGFLLSGGRFIRKIFKKPILFFSVLVSVLIMINFTATMYRNYIFGDTIRMWGDTAKKAPKSDRAHSALGGAYLDYYQDASASDKNVQYLYFAENELKAAIKLNYYNDTAHCNLAKVYYNLKEYQKCIDEANVANSQSESQYSYQNKGLAYKMLGETDKALESFLRGYKVDNKSWFILKSLGDTYYENKDYKNAGIYYQKLVDTDVYYKNNKEINDRLKESKNKNL